MWNAVAFSTDSKTLATASSDQTIRLWDVATGKEKGPPEWHGSTVWSTAFSPDGKTVVSAGEGTTVSGCGRQRRGSKSASSKGTRASFTQRPSLPMVKTDCFGQRSDRTIRLWEANNGREKATLKGHELEIRCVCFSPDGRALASASWDRTIRLWDIETGQTASANWKWRLRGDVWSVAFSPDGKSLVSGGADRTVRFWDVASGKELRKVQGDPGFVMCVAFSADGKTVAAGRWDRTIGLWDAATGKPLRTFSGHTANVCSVSFTPNWCSDAGIIESDANSNCGC